MELGSPRWKRGGHAISKSNPMSVIVSQLQEILIKSNAQAFVSGSDVFLEVTADGSQLLTRASFGVLETITQQQLFQLDFEEAFYLFDEMKCISISGKDGKLMGKVDIWGHMVSLRQMFPWHYQAYCHLRKKNWVVRSGSMYGVDFVVYRHHPSLVHSEFAAIVMSGDNVKSDARLRVWSDWEGTLRVCGSVAKTLLVIHVSNVKNGIRFPLCLGECIVNLCTITRWDPERSRDDRSATKQVLSKARKEVKMRNDEGDVRARGAGAGGDCWSCCACVWPEEAARNRSEHWEDCQELPAAKEFETELKQTPEDSAESPAEKSISTSENPVKENEIKLEPTSQKENA